MKKCIISMAVVALFATGCSSFGNKAPAPVTKIENKLETKPDIKKAEAEFLETAGTVQLQFSEEGDWLLIKTSGTAPINFNHAQGREDAFLLATMRAKRNLVEFLNNDVKSGKAVENITKTALKDIVSSNSNENRKRNKDTKTDELFGSDTEVDNSQYSQEERNRANKISQSVTETINDNSQGILRGAYIANRSIDRESNMVSVTLMVSKKSINTAALIRTQMNGF
jgi:hypothetical protein